jgi:uncharacterized coiled-coil DUF342 family protein
MAGVKTMLNNDWRDRAIGRRVENKALKKRIKELVISRNGWHDRAMEYKQQNDEYAAKLNSIKKKIDLITEI